MSEQALVVGTGAIGRAVTQRFCEDRRFERVLSVSRSPRDPLAAAHEPLRCDHSAAAIATCVDHIAAGGRLSRVVITLGTLHGDRYRPEKALRQLDAQAMAEVHRVNCILPLQWLAALAPLLRRAGASRVLVLSARVGSIGDNRRGGWYSYRSAKAALNMALRCAAIEFAQHSRDLKLIAYHPGTVDSDLSAPFQSRLPAGQLTAPALAAQRLVEVMEAAPADGRLSFLDWAGEAVPW